MTTLQLILNAASVATATVLAVYSVKQLIEIYRLNSKIKQRTC